MSTETRHIIVNGMRVDVVRKAIRNLHLGVYPPHGRIRVAAPVAVSEEAIRLAVITRLAWIKRQQAGFEKQERQSRRQYVSGECHYYLGQRYRLTVKHEAGRMGVDVKNARALVLSVRPGTDLARRERIFLAWYRRQLRATAEPLIEKWAKLIGVSAPKWGIRRMKTKWGSCSVGARRIWLNLELAKKPVQCLEYVIVHELSHLLERTHNDRFVRLMNRNLPQWRLLRDELNSAALSHEEWNSGR